MSMWNKVGSALTGENQLVPSNFKITVAIDMESSIKLGLILFFFIMLAVALGTVIGKKMA